MSRWSFPRWSDHGERGASAILVAASLLLLMGFAAIAVDAGVAFSERRQQASAADVGALAALQFAKTTLGVPSPECDGLTNNKDIAACRGAFEALDVIEGTLPGRYDDPAVWSACTDPDDDTLGYTQDSHISDCISFTSDLQRSRVLLPGTDVDTAFSRPLGFNFIGVGAFAEAGLQMDISGGVLPFALGPSAAGSNQACFFAQDSSSLDIDPCLGSTSGNFGKLNIRWYGNDLYGAPNPVCSGQNQWRLAMNIITGTDHPLEPHTKSPGIVNDDTNCDLITNPVDEIQTWTGNASGGIEDGFFNGVSSPVAYEGRLNCKDGVGAEDYPAFQYTSTGPCVSVNPSHQPQEIDHTPLWAFRTWTNGPCNGSISDRADMEACIAHYKTVQPTTGTCPGPTCEPVPLFSSDIVTSPRFGGVPELDTDPTTGNDWYLITGFKPVYLETVYYKCSGPNSCDIVHSPGEHSNGSPPPACPDPITPAATSCGWPQNGNKSIEATTAFILTLDMLPSDVADNFPYQDGTLVYNLYK